MTTIIFLLLFFGFFIALLNGLPVAGATNSVFLTSITTMAGYMKSWNFLFPISELFFCVGIVVVYEIAVYVWWASVWITKIIRGSTH